MGMEREGVAPCTFVPLPPVVRRDEKRVSGLHCKGWRLGPRPKVPVK